jgi:PAS domain S-box-containing protein
MPSLDSEPGHASRSITASRILAALALLDGIVVLSGWVLGLPALASLGVGPVCKPGTALGIIAAAVASWAVPPIMPEQRRLFGRWGPALSTGLGALALVIGVATLAQLTFAHGFQVYWLLLIAVPTALAAQYAAPMSAASAFGLALVGAAILGVNAGRARLAQSLATVAAVIGLVAVCGYVYEAAALAAIPLLAGTALPTAIALVLIGLSIVAARPRDGLMRLFTSTGLGGVIARRAILPIALAPVVINWIELSGERRGWYPTAMGWTLDAAFTIAALIGFTWWGASIIQQRDDAQRAMAARLVESEERYRQLVETSPDAIIVKRGKRIEEVNRATLALLGVADRAELIGRSPFALVEPSRREAVQSRLCALLEEPGGSIAVEDQVLRADGTVVDVALSASTLRVGDSRLVQVLMRDISDKKHHEQVLRESEERFRLIAETITQVFWMADVRIETIVYVSPAYEQVWGRSRESVYEHPRSFLEAIHPDDRARVLEDLSVQQLGLPFDHDYRIIRPDGQLRWIRDRGFPVRHPTKPGPLYVGVAEDITDRREHAEHLRESLERFELIARATHDATWEFDVRAGRAWWSDNLRRQFGFGHETAASFESWAAGIHPDDRDRVMASFATALDDTLEEWSEEYRYRRVDGSFAVIHDRAFIVRDGDRKPLRIVGSMQDVSAQRDLEARVRQSQKMEAFGQLAGGVAHDFNNILTTVLGFAELLLQTEPADSGKRLELTEIRDAARRAAALTRQLMLFSRREAIQLSRFDVNEAIRNLTRMLRRMIGEDIEVELALSTEPLWVDGDAGMFDQILLNLAVNARDAMPKGGRLTITSEPKPAHAVPASHRANAAPGSYVCIVVTDTGEGIAPESLPRIFEPFFTTKPRGKGTGLGLATVFGIVEQHRGWIDVESRVGEGTAMRLWLPASRSATTPNPIDTEHPPPRGGGETILVVEDDPAVLAITRAVLSRNGYNVLVATDGIEALRVADANRGTISLLLTDIVMPSGIDGRELAERLHVTAPTLKVLLTSGYSPDLPGMQRDLGKVQGFLRKPFTPDQLLAAVRHALDTSGR